MLDIKKYISNINNEAEYNSFCLQGVLASLSNYLASKSIFMPMGAYYDNFATANIGNGGISASENNERQEQIDENNSADITDKTTTDENSTTRSVIATKLLNTSGANIEKNVNDYENSATYQEDLKYAGIYEDHETQVKIISLLNEVVGNSDLAMRVTHDVLFKILSDGKFKNFFETGTTGGAKDEDGRKKSSKYLFGTNDGIKAEGFEKFGYLEAKIPQEHYYPMQQYGNVIIKFKNDRVNATFTCGDSLGFYQHKENGGIACLINKPSLCAMNKFQMKKLADAIKSGAEIPKTAIELSHFLSEVEGKQMPYFEIQFHGDLRIEDIESVTFTYGNYYGTIPKEGDKVITQLKNLGMKYDVCRL